SLHRVRTYRKRRCFQVRRLISRSGKGIGLRQGCPVGTSLHCFHISLSISELSLRQVDAGRQAVLVGAGRGLLGLGIRKLRFRVRFFGGSVGSFGCHRVLLFRSLLQPQLLVSVGRVCISVRLSFVELLCGPAQVAVSLPFGQTRFLT